MRREAFAREGCWSVGFVDGRSEGLDMLNYGVAPLIVLAADRCPVVAERIDFSWIGPEHVNPFVELCTDRHWIACN